MCTPTMDPFLYFHPNRRAAHLLSDGQVWRGYFSATRANGESP